MSASTDAEAPAGDRHGQLNGKGVPCLRPCPPRQEAASGQGTTASGNRLTYGGPRRQAVAKGHPDRPPDLLRQIAPSRQDGGFGRPKQNRRQGLVLPQDAAAAGSTSQQEEAPPAASDQAALSTRHGSGKDAAAMHGAARTGTRATAPGVARPAAGCLRGPARRMGLACGAQPAAAAGRPAWVAAASRSEPGAIGLVPLGTTRRTTGQEDRPPRGAVRPGAARRGPERRRQRRSETRGGRVRCGQRRGRPCSCRVGRSRGRRQ